MFGVKGTTFTFCAVSSKIPLSQKVNYLEKREKGSSERKEERKKNGKNTNQLQMHLGLFYCQDFQCKVNPNGWLIIGREGTVDGSSDKTCFSSLWLSTNEYFSNCFLFMILIRIFHLKIF